MKTGYLTHWCILTLSGSRETTRYYGVVPEFISSVCSVGSLRIYSDVSVWKSHQFVLPFLQEDR